MFPADLRVRCGVKTCSGARLSTQLFSRRHLLVRYVTQWRRRFGSGLRIIERLSVMGCFNG